MKLGKPTGATSDTISYEFSFEISYEMISEVAPVGFPTVPHFV